MMAKKSNKLDILLNQGARRAQGSMYLKRNKEESDKLFKAYKSSVRRKWFKENRDNIILIAFLSSAFLLVGFACFFTYSFTQQLGAS